MPFLLKRQNAKIKKIFDDKREMFQFFGTFYKSCRKLNLNEILTLILNKGSNKEKRRKENCIRLLERRQSRIWLENFFKQLIIERRIRLWPTVSTKICFDHQSATDRAYWLASTEVDRNGIRRCRRNFCTSDRSATVDDTECRSLATKKKLNSVKIV